MPNTRRRRFSVQKNIADRQSTKSHSGPSSHISIDDELKISVHTMVATKTNKSKFHANTSKKQSTLEIVAECDSTTSLSTVKDQSEMRLNLTQNITKDETAYPRNIYSETESSVNDASSDQCKVSLNPVVDHQKPEDSKQINRERTLRREKYPRQHRVKVRSPKRRTSIPEQGKSTDVTNMLNNKQSTGTIAINWEEEYESCRNVTSLGGDTDDDERPSTHSLDDMCRICHGGDTFYPELGRLISACLCRGTVGRVHVKCLERWLTESGKSRCELCGTRYITRRVHRYGVPRALVMWILSQNAKQLMVDSLGIMLMSPLAVLAAWLTGRTLAGLMTQESHVTPWPLASTFVLACMTLVCYYCWIVSAATRHALSWWIWYRSQYEVRLELQEIED